MTKVAGGLLLVSCKAHLCHEGNYISTQQIVICYYGMHLACSIYTKQQVEIQTLTYVLSEHPNSSAADGPPSLTK